MYYENRGSRSPEKNSQFDLAKDLAEAIGLTQPCAQIIPNIPYISNILPKKSRKRRLKGCDLLHIQKQANFKQVRERNKIIKQQQQSQRQKSIRKNSVKDVFLRYERPEENPLIYAKTQRIIVKRDMMRAQVFEEETQKIRKISSNKEKRSKILISMLEDQKINKANPIQDSHIENLKNKKMNFFYNPLFFIKRDRKSNKSDDNLRKSFDFSKFNVFPAQQGQFRLQQTSRPNTVQTTRSNRRVIKLKFNSSNKLQMHYHQNCLDKRYFSNIH